MQKFGGLINFLSFFGVGVFWEFKEENPYDTSLLLKSLCLQVQWGSTYMKINNCSFKILIFKSTYMMQIFYRSLYKTRKSFIIRFSDKQW